MDEATSTLPADMVPFIQTPVAQPFTRGRNVGLASSTALATVLFFLLQWLAFATSVAAGIALLTLVINITVLVMRYQSHASTPLAVNINHPFMSDEPMGKAKVMVRLSDGRWCDAGPNRLRVIPDELLGGYGLAQDTMDFPVLGHFSSLKQRTPTLVRHLALINQAIALRDAVNEVPDPIDDAREREEMDSGLLERSWLEEEGEVEVESPLVAFFGRKE